jgi:DNA-directed RNA polymerase I subunit RPA2
MIDKLYSFVAGECGADNLDAVCNQEVMLGGHLYGQLLSEKLADLLIGARAKIVKDIKNPKFDQTAIRNPNYLKKCMDTQTSIGHKLEHFLATGNLITRSQLDLQQTAGFTIVADKLNNTRYLSHFRSIHRGQYFTEMKTTTVRKLLPEAWGFICPVHTPDGSPCGLLNHISMACAPLAQEDKPINEATFKALLGSLGMNAQQSDFNLTYPHHFLPVTLDGVLQGCIDPKLAPHLVNSLRQLKVEQKNFEVPITLEIAYMPPGRQSSAAKAPPQPGEDPERPEINYSFPGVFLSSQIARFVRPVRNLMTGGTEWIGPLEQVNLSIATLTEDLRGDSTH